MSAAGASAAEEDPAAAPRFKLELYPTERRYSVANFDRNCSLDFSGQRSLRLALQEGREEEEEESEEVRKQLAEQQARPKRYRTRERAPLARKWVVSDGKSAYEGTVNPTAEGSSSYVLLVPHGASTFHVIPVADRVTFRTPGPQGLTLKAADEKMEAVRAAQAHTERRLHKGRSKFASGSGRGADADDDPFALPVKRSAGGGGGGSRSRRAELKEDRKADFGDGDLARSDDEELGVEEDDVDGDGGEDEDDGMGGFDEDAVLQRALRAGSGVGAGGEGGAGGGALTIAESLTLQSRKEREARRRKVEALDEDAFSGEFTAANDELLAADLAAERAAEAAAKGELVGGAAAAGGAAAMAPPASKKRGREDASSPGALPRAKLARHVSGIDLALEQGTFTQDTVISELKRFGGSMTIKNLLRRMKPLLKQKKSRIELQEIIRMVGNLDDDQIEGKVLRLKAKFA